jgi:hypothetical protein
MVLRRLGCIASRTGSCICGTSNTQGAGEIRFFFGNPGDVPIAGDFNGDGFDTVSIYRPSIQTFFIINALGANEGGLGAAEFSYVFGDPGDKPFVGDFDGDGVETVGLHRESTGLVYFRNSHSQGNADAQFIFGDPGDRLIAGDWNADGAYSPASVPSEQYDDVLPVHQHPGQRGQPVRAGVCRIHLAPHRRTYQQVGEREEEHLEGAVAPPDLHRTLVNRGHKRVSEGAMALIDAKQVERGSTVRADVCIVGGGPAGIALALSLVGSRLSVVLLESGGTTQDPDSRDLNVGVNTGLPYYDLDETRHRGLGGGSQRWAGWCRPLDRSDFEPRDVLATTGWPITYDDLLPFYDEAAVLCEIDPISEDRPTSHLPAIYREPFVGGDIRSRHGRAVLRRSSGRCTEMTSSEPPMSPCTPTPRPSRS